MNAGAQYGLVKSSVRMRHIISTDTSVHKRGGCEARISHTISADEAHNQHG